MIYGSDKMGEPKEPEWTEDMSVLDFYVAQKKYEKDLYSRVDYEDHWCDKCEKTTRHKVTYTAFRSRYTCTVCGRID